MIHDSIFMILFFFNQKSFILTERLAITIEKDSNLTLYYQNKKQNSTGLQFETAVYE